MFLRLITKKCVFFLFFQHLFPERTSVDLKTRVPFLSRVLLSGLLSPVPVFLCILIPAQLKCKEGWKETLKIRKQHTWSDNEKKNKNKKNKGGNKIPKTGKYRHEHTWKKKKHNILKKREISRISLNWNKKYFEKPFVAPLRVLLMCLERLFNTEKSPQVAEECTWPLGHLWMDETLQISFKRVSFWLFFFPEESLIVL